MNDYGSKIKSFNMFKGIKKATFKDANPFQKQIL